MSVYPIAEFSVCRSASRWSGSNPMDRRPLKQSMLQTSIAGTRCCRRGQGPDFTHESQTSIIGPPASGHRCFLMRHPDRGVRFWQFLKLSFEIKALTDRIGWLCRWHISCFRGVQNDLETGWPKRLNTGAFVWAGQSSIPGSGFPSRRFPPDCTSPELSPRVSESPSLSTFVEFDSFARS